MTSKAATVQERKRKLALRQRQRLANARERGRKLIETARARARKLVETARARARKLVETVRRPKARTALKERAPTGTSKGVTIGTRVRTAYAALREETGLRNVAIADLQQRSHVQRRELLEYLQKECAAHRANPTLGEPTAATKAELKHALQIGDRAYIYVELLGGNEPKRKPRGATMTTDVRSTPAAVTAKQLSQFNKALLAVKAENKPNALLSVGEVRAQAHLPKSVFDRIALDLAATNLLVLHHHDFPASLSAAERLELIVDPKGTHYVGMALRRPESPTPDSDVDAAILRAAKELTHGKPEAIRIARLRERLPAVDTDSFDRAISRLHRGGKVALYRDDNRVTANDRGAYFIAGEPRHLLYLKG